MKKELLALVAVMFFGCVTSSDRTDSKSAQIGYLGRLMEASDFYPDSLAPGYTRIHLFDFDACTISNKCIKPVGSTIDSNGNNMDTPYTFDWFNGGINLYIKSDSLSSRLADKGFKKLFESSRVQLGIFANASKVNPDLYLAVFDEKPKCLNIDQPLKDTIIVNGTKDIVDRIHTPCIPYIYESEMPRK